MTRPASNAERRARIAAAVETRRPYRRDESSGPWACRPLPDRPRLAMADMALIGAAAFCLGMMFAAFFVVDLPAADRAIYNLQLERGQPND